MAARIAFRFDGNLRGLRSAIKRALAAQVRRARRAQGLAAVEIARRVQRELKRAAPVRTGRLRRSIRRPKRTRRGDSVFILPRMVFYGPITNATGPHRGWATRAIESVANDSGYISAVFRKHLRSLPR